jgi:microcystin-dependent protein
MSCSNCFNGCAEITSDKCVRYTGENVPALGISYGDTLLHVENQLVRFILSVLDGTGIVIDVPQSVVCDLIKKHLPTCPSYQLDELIITILKAVCDLQTQIDTINSKITALNADYTIGCLTGVTASSDTHEVLQATINKLCSVSTGLTALILNVNTNYVKIADINTYIANYLASIAPANRAYTRMVPYVPMPYVGALSGFPAPADQLSATGQGVGYWEKVYLCNGLNGTPDLRGRMTVGAISGVGGGPLNSAVDPANPLNPNYTNGTTTGSNFITLSTAQIPSHTHSVLDSGHTHAINVVGTSSQSDSPNGAVGYPTFNSTQGLGVSFTNPATVAITAATANSNITLGNTGGGEPHANNQPAYGTYYIMYIP